MAACGHVKWTNINKEQLIKYVSICCDRRVIEKDNLGQVIPVAKPRTTLNSTANPSKKVREAETDI